MPTRGEPPRSAMTARASKVTFAHGYVYFPACHGNSMFKTHRTSGRMEDAAREYWIRLSKLPEHRAAGPGAGASILSRSGTASRLRRYLGARLVHRWRSPTIGLRRIGALKDAIDRVEGEFAQVSLRFQHVGFRLHWQLRNSERVSGGNRTRSRFVHFAEIIDKISIHVADSFSRIP